MLGAFLVFCVCVGAFLWHLMVEADKEKDDQGVLDVVDGGPHQQGERSRKRNRKKGRQHGKAGRQRRSSVGLVVYLVLHVCGRQTIVSGSLVHDDLP